MGGHPQHVCSRVGERGRHWARRCHGVAVRARRRVRAVPDLQQRTLALRTAPRSHRSRLPSHVRRPYARSKDAAVTGTLAASGERLAVRVGQDVCVRGGVRRWRADLLRRWPSQLHRRRPASVLVARGSDVNRADFPPLMVSDLLDSSQFHRGDRSSRSSPPSFSRRCSVMSGWATKTPVLRGF